MVLRLEISGAEETVSGETQTLAWNVCEQPWSEGDLLMLRIVASPELKASDGAGDSACVSGPARSASEPPASAPRKLSAKSKSLGSIEVTREAPDDPSITGYRILKTDSLGHRRIQLRVFDIHFTETSYLDTEDIVILEAYEYQVQAFNDAGFGPVAFVSLHHIYQ